MLYHYVVVQVGSREQAESVSNVLSEALTKAKAKGETCFDTKMYVVSSEHLLKSTYELIEDLIRDRSE